MRFLIAALALLVAMPPAVMAGQGKSKKAKDKHQQDSAVQVTVHFGDRERAAVRNHYVKTHGRGNCPPGLAKKNNGCLPPGQAKKRYTVGEPLPASVVVVDLPTDISIRLGSPPRGYRYGLVDGDVVKLVLGTALVVDAIDGLTD
jgi:hypothetical protein